MNELSQPAASTASGWSPRLTEAAVVVAIIVVSTLLGVRVVQTYHAAGFVPSFYQPAFGPAVMLACGQGFRNPDTRDLPPLAAFLSEQDDRFDCAALPATPATLPLDNFQTASRYLELTVGLLWTIVGVSWSRVAILSGLLFGFVAALTYALLRLGLSRPFALGLLIPAATSTPNFDLLPHLRDYAKGPFLLAIIFILGWLVTRRVDRRRVFELSVLAGVVVGVGLGFRTDLAIAIVPMVVTLAALLPSQVRGGERLIAILLFFSAFVAAGWPILRGYAAGGNTGHVVLLGLSPEFDRSLRVEPSIYQFAGHYNDSVAFSIINSYAIRTRQFPEGVKLGSREYEQAARGYLTEIARVFPADLLTRVVAAVRVVPRYFLDSSLSPPQQARSAFLRAIYRVRASVWSRLALFSLPALLIVVVALAAIQPRAAGLVVLVMLGFAGASALQFHERHFYYLQFVPWLAFGLIAEAMVRRQPIVGLDTPHLKSALLLTGLIATAAVAAYMAAIAYQQRTATRLFEKYESAQRTPMPIVDRTGTAGRRLLGSDDWFAPVVPGGRWIEAQVIAVEFDNANASCTPGVPLTVRYSAIFADADLSEDLVVPLQANAASPTRLFIAAFDRADESIRFRGVEVVPGQARCVVRLSRAHGLEQTPLLLTTRLADGWHDERLVERLAW